MSNLETSINVIRETFESLQKSEVVASDLSFSEELIVLGSNTAFDSLGFVTFISDLEDRASEVAGRDVFLVLDDINDFNLNSPSLTVKALSMYVASLLDAEG